MSRRKQTKLRQITYNKLQPVYPPEKINLDPDTNSIHFKLRQELINPEGYFIKKYWGERGLYGWVVCKSKTEELSQAFNSKEKAYEWLQIYEQQQALEHHFSKSIIVPDYFL